ncbi:unnamed protein product [Diamesa hyperborea]
MSDETGTIAKKKLPSIINLTLDHLKTTINYKAIPNDSKGNEFFIDEKMSIVLFGKGDEKTLTKESKTFIFKIPTADVYIFNKRFTVDISYIFLNDLNAQLFSSRYSFGFPVFRSKTEFQFEFLDHFHPEKAITTLYRYNFEHNAALNITEQLLLKKIDESYRSNRSRQNINHIQMLKCALSIEDIAAQDSFKRFDLEDVTLDGCINQYHFTIPESNAKALKFILNEMSLCLIPSNLYNEIYNNPTNCIFAKIDNITNDIVNFTSTKILELKVSYNINFIGNRITIRSSFQALEAVNMNRLNDYFENFENEPGIYDTQRFQQEVKFENFEWFNEKIATNEEQMTAIKNIVNCTAFPFPYVIFGPPGTGKTSTLVECVAQILKLKPESKIMITAQSNSACDEIGVRLMKVISPNKIFRLYSPSLLNPKNGVTNPELRRSSNIRSHQNQYPSYEEFYHFNVVIVTLMSSSRLVQVKINNKHFDYMFIDECAAAMEPECLVPILGLGTGFQEITTNLVFLGDHKQLGPVIESDFAEKIGLGHSLMERIMTKSKYQNKPHYNVNYVTQLLDNYRSHPAILQFSNVMFYDSMLRCKISEEEKNFAADWNLLTNINFPIIFHSSKSPSQTERFGTSSYNEVEIQIVKHYVNQLLACKMGGSNITELDIGIVSPYKAQLYKLRKEFHYLKDIEIGTAEYYQGREKKIIIISTVKSQNSVGFLKSEKRLNVVLTRAKSLLIIVGNPETLQRNSNWNSFIHFCKNNEAFAGDQFHLKQLSDDEERLVANLSLSLEQSKQKGDAIGNIQKDDAIGLAALEDRLEKIKKLLKKKILLLSM